LFTFIAGSLGYVNCKRKQEGSSTVYGFVV
jgi:hypothetical protein